MTSVVIQTFGTIVVIYNEGDKISNLKVECQGSSKSPSSVEPHRIALALMNIVGESDMSVTFTKDDGKTYGIKNVGYFEGNLFPILVTIEPSGSTSLISVNTLFAKLINSNKKPLLF